MVCSVSSEQEVKDRVLSKSNGKNDQVYDWSDFSNWPEVLTLTMKYEIVKWGPIQIKSWDFPFSSNGEHQRRRFTVNYYYRKLPNNEVINRQWLVYSKIDDCVVTNTKYIHDLLSNQNTTQYNSRSSVSIECALPRGKTAH
ncbi:unnamed protein product [Macrosiphum euphorbiae]|uniref:Uncharacterized protein n=1 Tax=Macrosiphum euphorbiae TaxID=13131 RepID=A0AAV0YAN1_9HEMI|nr:unnamed protein product [Macrosiphum euphorbiae]